MLSLLPGSSLGRYELIEKIGQGGMATVFRARDPQLDRMVAVKVLPSFENEDPAFVERFKREAQSVAGLNHPNIIQVHDFGEDKGFMYIVMELVTNGTLSDRMTRKMALTEVMSVIVPLAAALDYAHGRGIIHRDIKPNNVLMAEDDRLVLSDFGLAKVLEASVAITKADSAMGTPEYMAPEQALGRDIDKRADLYSLGIMIYQMLLGQTPFRGDTPSTTLLAHIHSPVPLPSSVEPDFDRKLESTVIKALAKDPNDRFQSSADLVKALSATAPAPETEALEDSPESAATIVDAPAMTVESDESTVVRRPGGRRIPAWVAGVGGVAVVSAVIAALVFMVGGGDVPDESTTLDSVDPTGPQSALASEEGPPTSAAAEESSAQPVVSAEPSVGHIVYSTQGRVYRVEAREGAEPEDVTTLLDDLSSGTEDLYISVSSGGEWLVLDTDRFDDECVDWTCVAVVAGDLSEGDAVRVNPGYWDIVHAWDGTSAISSEGDLLVYATDSEEPRQADIFAVSLEEGAWGEPTRITSESPYTVNVNPALSIDQSKVVFQCGDDGWYGHSICEVDVDGSGFRVVVGPEARASEEPEGVTLHNPTFAPDGSMVFAGNWDGDRIWRVPAGGGELVSIRGEHWSPCTLPDGRIAGVVQDWSRSDEVPDYNINVISPNGSTAFTVTVLKEADQFAHVLSCSG